MKSAVYTGVFSQSSQQQASRVMFLYFDLIEAGRELLAEQTRMLVMDQVGRRPRGPIRVLAPVRYFGLKPALATFYYCFNADDTAVEFVVAKTSDPSSRERQTLVLECEADSEVQEQEERNVQLPESCVWNFSWPNPHKREPLLVSLESYTTQKRTPDSFASLNLVVRPWLSAWFKWMIR